MMTTYFYTAFTQKQQRGARKPHGVPAFIGLLGWLRALRHARGRRRQYQYLEELPDYLLDDIGLTRGDIARARRRDFWS
ncbi:DUF1127 domain-containing protein [Salipiger sp. PrR002]|uniref:DUF1127 domain-containing protein n=1 Tax=Salipiger sp. PrR002 TaxID=2706489 RepID=UPI0013B5B453|nr:DUF1127 domain-containing protein [Salipiger sp. PrR002]NDW00172.1 DUF1127 domain-containing protein [Salipiger sp. PrR002]NDW56819.1 DUF1127 domain-containing protein [Salipiger sp. PrR004]